MQLAYREMLSTRMIGIVLTTGGIIAGVFTVIGPIGTYLTFTPLQRLTYCVVCWCLGTPVFYSISVVTLYLMRSRSRFATALAMALAMVIAAAPCTTIAYTFRVLFYPSFPPPELLPIYATAVAVAVPSGLLFQYVIWQRIKHAGEPAAYPVPDATGMDLVAAGDSGPGRLDAHGDAHDVLGDLPPTQLLRQSGSTRPVAERSAELPPPQATRQPGEAPPTTDSAPSTEEDAEPRPPFFQRLPVDVLGDLIYLKTENHYVQVHTTAGSTRLLLRFADAIAELGDLGMQVHRSYWVAHRQVMEVVRRDNRTLLRLTGDHEVPVSRSYVPAVQAALSN